MHQLEVELTKDIYKESYYEFFKFCFGLLSPTEKFEDNFHIKYLCDIFQKEVFRMKMKEPKERDLIINIPPRTSKSLICSVCLLPWVWIHIPECKFITVSFDSDLALLNSQFSKDIIKSAEYQALFGDIFKIRPDADSKGFFMNDKGGYRLSKTNGSSVVGFSGQIIVLDDPQSAKTSTSEAERQATIDYWSQSLYNRLTPAELGLRVLVQQRLHEEDLSGYLLGSDPEEELYQHINLPAELLPSTTVKPAELSEKYVDGLLDPNRLNRMVLKGFQVTLLETGYAGQYLQNPSPAGGGILKREWFDIVDPSELSRVMYDHPTHIFIDPAYTKNTMNDPTGHLACFLKDRFLYILDAGEVWKEFPQLIVFLKEYAKRQRMLTNSKMYVEPKASGKSIVQQLAVESDINVIESTPPDNDKITRANGISARLEARRVKLVKGAYTEKFLSQLELFPNAKHDDMVDCLIMAVENLLGVDLPAFTVLYA